MDGLLSDIVSIISSVGFPVVVAGYLIWTGQTREEKNNQMLQVLKDSVDKNTEVTQALKETIERTNLKN